MAKDQFARPRTLDRQGVDLTDEWGDIYDMGRIDELYIRVTTNPAEIRFSPKLANGGQDWEPEMYLQSGGTHQWTDGAMNAFGLFQLRRASAGSASQVNITSICKG